MSNLRDMRDITPEKVYVRWFQVEEFVSWLSEQTDGFRGINGVYAPARGGLVIGVMISNKYNLPFLAAPQVGCICVDDICDTGDTALAWREKGYKIATMFYKKGSKVCPDFWRYEKEDKWIVFPWE
jgi:hypoxanthine phosphoribosyltransferase